MWNANLNDITCLEEIIKKIVSENLDISKIYYELWQIFEFEGNEIILAL
jgi:hypothetical protein